MTKRKQPESGTDEDNPDLPLLTSEEEAWDRACDALLNARLVTKFGPKLEFTEEEMEAAYEELDAEGAFPNPPW